MPTFRGCACWTSLFVSVCVNVIWLTSVRKVWSFLRLFSWFSNACLTVLCAGLLYRPKLDSKCRKYGCTHLSKVWLLLRWFSRNLQSFNAVFTSAVPKFSKPDKKFKNVGKISVMPSSKLLYRFFMQNSKCSVVLLEDFVFWILLKANTGNMGINSFTALCKAWHTELIFTKIWEVV